VGDGERLPRGALASGVWEWARFRSGGPGGGTSGAGFGILGAAILLGVLAGGGYRRYAIGVLAVTVFLLTWMYDHEGSTSTSRRWPGRLGSVGPGGRLAQGPAHPSWPLAA
jgi:hypothetical protein